jgi:PAS domain S-box-containing protein
MFSTQSDWPRWVAIFAGSAVSALGAAVLVAWHFHFTPVIQVLPTLAPMHPMTALEFLLGGAALFLVSIGHKHVAGVFALAMLIPAVLVALEYVLQADFGIDQLLGADDISPRSSHPGRLAPVTTLGLLAGSLSLLVMSSRTLARRASGIVGIVASAVIAAGMVSVLAYLGRARAYGWGHFSEVAIHNGAGHALLGAGLLALAWQERPAKEGLPRWMPLSVGLGVAVAVLGVWQALLTHRESTFPLLSGIVLAGGFLMAVFLALAIHQTQKAWGRSRELQEGKAMLERLFEAVPDALLVVDGQGRIIGGNHRVESLFGYARDELLGQLIESLVPVKLQDLHKVDREGYCAHPSMRPMGQELDLCARRKDDSKFPVEVSLSPMRLEGEIRVLAVVRDVTERKQAQEALRQSEERFRGVFETSPLGIALIQQDYRIAKVNPSLCRMSEYSEAELTGLNAFELTHPDDRHITADLAERLFQGKIPSYQLEKRYLKKSGEIIWTNLTATVLRDREGRPLLALGMIADITERKRAEDALRLSQERLSQATRFASLGVWDWDLRTNLAVWDDTMFEIFGIPKAASVSREDWGPRIHREDLLKVEAFVEKAVRGKTQDRLEFRIIRPDGSLRHISSAGGVVLDEQRNAIRLVGIAVDITERKRAEDELRTLSERLSLATRIASLGVWDWDLHTNLGVWDDASFEMFGMPKANPVRREDFVRRIHPDDLARLQASTQRVIRRKTQASVEFRIIRPDGSLRYLSVAEGAVLDEQGNVSRVIGIAVDITDRKQMEAKLEASREQMIASARLSALGMMAGGIAHEINNPLAIIHAMASDLVEMVEEGSAPPGAVARKGAIIRETADRIARIVKSLRRISREGSSDSLHPTPLAKILEETLEICRERFTANGVKLLLPDTVPEFSVVCREVQISQALLNLLQNAFDAVVEQPGERWVRLDAGRCDDSVAISVIDNGPGIPPELRSRIMEPFFTTKEIGKGTGLGLSLSKTIAEEHGGKLEYGQDNGHTRFSLVLPMAKEAEAA